MRYIIGVGNYSMWDDGIGIRVIEYISENGLEDNSFQALDLSGNGIDILHYFSEETEKLIIIDASTVDRSPGEYKLFRYEDVKTKKDLSGITSHEGDILKIIELGKVSGYFVPPIVFMGIQPEVLKNEIGISKTLEKLIPQYAATAIKEVQK